MSVDAYTTEFSRLSKFAPSLAAEERERTYRF